MADGTATGPKRLPTPEVGVDAALTFVGDHLGHLSSGPATASSIRGGQRAADAALTAYDVGGYASARNEVAPPSRRGASKLSPYIRHGLLSLADMWDAVAGGPSRDVDKFRDELLWQEYARHWYARLGERTRRGTRRELTGADAGWDRSMRCIEFCLDELESDGWLVNQTRMWLSSHWTVRLGGVWQRGEDEFFRNLLDGSRAANRLGWQWTTGVGSSKPYGFSRWQVRKRAPSLCRSCEHRDDCPIESWPDDPSFDKIAAPSVLRSAGSDAPDTGPDEVITSAEPDVVWLTAESLGSGDPALAARPELAVVFVFDEPLLQNLQLSAKRLVFLVETLAEIAEVRELRVFLGRPADALRGQRPAVTFAPVPGFRRIAARVEPAELHPWPWMRPPHDGSVASFSAWRKRVSRAS